MARFYYENWSETYNDTFRCSVYDSEEPQFALCETQEENAAIKICEALNFFETNNR